ncbi:MAG: PEGA domain-containing protein [Candidatus Aminicenantes bacterium]|nr:PEGA domain-containing protein [Candidatus Aminicenantes bacterium]
MKRRTSRREIIFASVLLLFFLLIALDAAQIKLKVVLDNASIKATQSIGGRTLARVPLNTILDAESKEGQWYKVTYQGETGWIYYTNVEETTGEATSGMGTPGMPTRTQAEIVAEIEVKMDNSTRLISLERKYDEAVEALRPLIARAFSVTDHRRQLEIATKIYYWMGMAYANKGDSLSALKEFKNMFEANYAYAKTIVRLNPDAKILTLTDQADKEFRGLVTEYSLEITTEPKEAKIKINGKEIGYSPEIYRTTSPEVALEIEKEGYKPIRDEFFITSTPFKKEYTLERAGRNMEIRSNPVGARIFLDGTDTNQVTNCTLSFVSFGKHTLKITKENYADWEQEIEIKVGVGVFPITASLTPIKYKYIHKWGSPVSQIFKDVAGVAVDSQNNIYIVSEGARKIQKITSDWKFDNTWGDGGKEARVIKSPGGIAIDKQGNVFVTDAKNHCIIKFDQTGKFKIKWGDFGAENHQFNEPLGIATDSQGNVYVVDSVNSRVKKYDNNSKLLRIWGRRGAADGDFVYPKAIAINQKDEVFVLDRTRVQKFTANGEFISKWGKAGSTEGAFKVPLGISIDQGDFVYIADSENNRIQKYDLDGNLITWWGSTGTGDGQLMNPVSIAVDSRGYVYVVEKDNSRVQLFGVDTQ